LPTTAVGPVTDVAAFINEYFRAWQGTDEEAIMNYYSENVLLQLPGTRNGRENSRPHRVRAPLYHRLPGKPPHRQKYMIHAQGVVAVEWNFEAEHKGTFAGRAATGNQVKVPGCSVYEYDSAKRQITAGRIYLDMGTLLKQIGAP
jgi:hypothetical protein